MTAVALLFLYSIAAFGLAFCAGFAKISFGVRVWLSQRESRPIHWFVLLLECPACLGFWIGLITAPWVRTWQPFAREIPLIPFMILHAFFTCGSNFIIGRATGLIRDNPEIGDET